MILAAESAIASGFAFIKSSTSTIVFTEQEEKN
jgi:hypothetical protein